MLAATILQQQQSFDVFSQLASIIDAFFGILCKHLPTSTSGSRCDASFDGVSAILAVFARFFFSDLAFLPNADIELPFFILLLPFLTLFFVSAFFNLPCDIFYFSSIFFPVNCSIYTYAGCASCTYISGCGWCAATSTCVSAAATTATCSGGVSTSCVSAGTLPSLPNRHLAPRTHILIIPSRPVTPTYSPTNLLLSLWFASFFIFLIFLIF